MLVFCLLLIGDMANAQVCKINGSNDNIEVFGCQLNDDTVTVTLSNDSNDIKANVTVTVEVTYGNNTRTYTGKVLSEPGKSTTLDINIDKKVGIYTPKSATVTSISGTKCL